MSPPLTRNSTAASGAGVLVVIAPISMSSEMIAPLNPRSDLSILMVTGDRSARMDSVDHRVIEVAEQHKVLSHVRSPP